MTWNPLKLRRMVADLKIDCGNANWRADNWRASFIAAANERDDAIDQLADRDAEIARLKSPPRGDRGRFVGRGE